MASITIENVDPELLEQQRKQLISLEDKIRDVPILCASEVEALVGVIGMLDAWSDAVYFANNPVNKARG